ncbi:hypothetical protein B0H19DRAFT_1099716 [Mycena capillaripes]|nr:hypothetical protein B0H19DRAFT_1099716 [Mycena capillaripes]
MSAIRLTIQQPDWNVVYYSAHMGYDCVACATGTLYLIFSSRIQGTFNMSRFVRRVLRNGLLYFLLVFAANLWVVLEFEEVLKTGVGATLPLALVLIAAQHLILSTHRLHPEQSLNTDDFSRSGPLNINNVNSIWKSAPPSRVPRDSRQDLEMESGVYVVRETYTQRSDDLKEPPNRHSESTSINDNKIAGVGFAI